MNGVVLVGVIITLMFLVSFTNWFYHLLAGTNALIVGDNLRGYRIFIWTIGAVSFMGLVFWTNATIQECPTPEEEREGVFVYVDCTVYDWVKTTSLGSYLPGPRDALIEPVKEPEKEAPSYPTAPQL